ncbi:MAG: hypothetical protein J0G95_07705 [Rhizobiales bacterium]|nr:hypothetical protein [Hyphomicrobiales bacterium]
MCALFPSASRLAGGPCFGRQKPNAPEKDQVPDFTASWKKSGKEMAIRKVPKGAVALRFNGRCCWPVRGRSLLRLTIDL